MLTGAGSTGMNGTNYAFKVEGDFLTFDDPAMEAYEYI